MAEIGKLDAARRQLDCAIGLLDTEDLAAHTLAYAAYRILREMLGEDALKVLLKLEKGTKLGQIPGFLRHARGDADAILKEHSADTAYLTIALGIRLWEEHGQKQTAAMQEFGKRPVPYQQGYRHSAAVDAARSEPLSEFKNTLNHPSS